MLVMPGTLGSRKVVGRSAASSASTSARIRSSTAIAWARTVGCSKSSRIGRSTSNSCRSPAISRVASSEWPPRSEEVVVDADPRVRAAPPRSPATRFSTTFRGARGGVRRRRRAPRRAGCAARPVELAVGGERDPRPAPRRRPAPCSRAAAAAQCAAHGPAGSGASADRGRRPGGPRRRVRTTASRTRGCCGSDGADLARLDPVAADLDLVVARPRNSRCRRAASGPRSPVR